LHRVESVISNEIQYRMIATELYDGQGLGNQLWVYAAARSIAEQLGIGFVLKGYERFKGREFLEIDPMVNVTVKEQQYINECAVDRFYETQYYDGDLKYFSSGFDERVNQLRGHVQLEGLFQSERYFFGNLDKINRYIRLKQDWLTKVTVPDDTCILNVRGGEYKRHKNLILPMNYWKQAIKNMSDNTETTKYLIVTDDTKYARAIFPNYEILSGDIGECYSALYNAKNLILSNSSFAYFPAKINPHTPYVIAPMYWARYGNKLKRWASPANLYTSWLWQDEMGTLHTYNDCTNECDATERYYQSRYFVRSSHDQLLKKGFRQLMPITVRNYTKRFLSMAFPTKFG